MTAAAPAMISRARPIASLPSGSQPSPLNGCEPPRVNAGRTSRPATVRNTRSDQAPQLIQLVRMLAKALQN